MRPSIRPDESGLLGVGGVRGAVFPSRHRRRSVDRVTVAAYDTDTGAVTREEVAGNVDGKTQ